MTLYWAAYLPSKPLCVHRKQTPLWTALLQPTASSACFVEVFHSGMIYNMHTHHASRHNSQKDSQHSHKTEDT